MSTITVSQVYVGMFQNYLEQLQTRRPDLKLYDISMPKLSGSDSERLSLDALESYINSIVEKVNSRSFGLDVGGQMHPSDYGILGYTLMNCSTLYQAAQLVTRYAQLLNQSFRISLSELDEMINFQVECDSNRIPSLILIEMQMASMVQMAHFLAGPQKKSEIKLAEVHFKHEAMSSLDKYQRIFNCPIYFNQDTNKMVLHKSIMSFPIRSASPKMLTMLLRKVSRLDDELKNKLTFERRVCDFVEYYFSEIGMPTASIVASHFNISQSTLKKYLHKEQKNFSAICDEIRKKAAIRMVSNSTMQLQAISDRLGFSSSSAFHRAFRRWTHMSPAEYRRGDESVKLDCQSGASSR